MRPITKSQVLKQGLLPTDISVFHTNLNLDNCMTNKHPSRCLKRFANNWSNPCMLFWI